MACVDINTGLYVLLPQVQCPVSFLLEHDYDSYFVFTTVILILHQIVGIALQSALSVQQPDQYDSSYVYTGTYTECKLIPIR